MFLVHPRQGLVILVSLTLGAMSTVDHARAEEIINQQLLQPGTAEHPTAGPWNVTIGIGVGAAPNFEGASTYHATALPYGNISYNGRGFLGTEGSTPPAAEGVQIGLLGGFLGPQGFGVNLIRVGAFRAGVLAGYAGGRQESDDAHLHGLGDISGAIQMGGYASYRWNAVEIRAQLRQAVTHSDNGLEASLGATYSFQPTDRIKMTVGPQLVFADGARMQTFFGVTPAQSQASGLRVFSAGGGINDVAFGVNGTYQLTPKWLVFGVAKISEIVGDAANSPIVQSKEQFFGGAGLAYHF